MTDQIATLALVEFRRRQANARKAIAAKSMSAERAEAALRPWAALALRAGADLPEAAEAVTGILVLRGPATTQQERRCIVADTLCPWPDMVQALASARDKALDRGNDEAANPLIRLGREFGPLPPYRGHAPAPAAAPAAAPAPIPPVPAPGQPERKAA